MSDAAAKLKEALAALWSRLRPSADSIFGIDLRALAAFRIGAGIYIICDLLDRSRDIEAHYTDFGVSPHQAVYLYDTDHWANMSPYMWFDGVVPVALFMVFAAVLAVLLALGWKTRPVAILSYFMLAGIQSRNPMVLHGADLLLRCVFFWALFTPLGARWSLDGMAAQWRSEGRTVPRRTLSWGTAGMLLQVAIMYWITAIVKNAVEWRAEGSAVYYALTLQEYATPFGQWLRMQAPLLTPATHLTWYLECVGPIIAFIPWQTNRLRTFITSVFIGFHLVLLNLCFDLGPFPYVATLVWLPFFPSSVWDWFEWVWARCPLILRSVSLRAREFTAGWQQRVVEGRVRAQRPAPRLNLSSEWQYFSAFLVVYMVLWNVRGLDWANRSWWIPSPLHFVARMLRLDQGWGMFAPKPLVEDGWFVDAAKLKKDPDFSFNAYTGKAPIDWSQPVHLVSMYHNERWRKYMMNLFMVSNLNQRVFYCRWVCANWNRVHNDAEQMERFQLYYMKKTTHLNYVESKPVKVRLWDQYCFDIPAESGKTVKPAEQTDRKMQWP